MDVKGAARAAAPQAKGATMPSDQGDRGVEGAPAQPLQICRKYALQEA